MKLSPEEQEEMERLQKEFDACSGGDRPQSPPAANIKRLMELEDKATRFETDLSEAPLKFANLISVGVWSLAIQVVRDYQDLSCVAFEKKYGITDGEGLVEAMEKVKRKAIEI